MLQVTEPFHGALLNHRNGKQTDDSLIIEVHGLADESAKVSVNGVAATRNGAEFTAETALTDKEMGGIAFPPRVGIGNTNIRLNAGGLPSPVKPVKMCLLER